MDYNLNHSESTMAWLGRLSAAEGLAMLSCCRGARHAMKPFFPGLAFAMTRPKLHTNGPPLTLDAWTNVLGECVASVRNAGLDPGLLVHAEFAQQTYEFAVDEFDGHDRVEKALFRFGESAFLCRFMRMSLLPGHSGIQVVPESRVVAHMNGDGCISAVVSVHARKFNFENLDGQEHGSNYCTSLVITSGGHFALLKIGQKFIDIDEQVDGHWQVGSIYLGETLAEVLAVVQEHGGEVLWKSLVLTEDTEDGEATYQWQGRPASALGLVVKHADSERWNDVPGLSPDCVFHVPGPSGLGLSLGAKSLDWPKRLLQKICDGVHGCSSQLQQDRTDHIRDVSDVTQTVVHHEPAASRDPVLLQMQSDEDWASLIEQRLHGQVPIAQDESQVEEGVNENVWLLQYKNCGEEFKDALCDGLPLCACRDALMAEGHSFVLPDSEAKIFIKPSQWNAVMSSLNEKQLHLRPYHVIVTESFEHLVGESIMTIRYRRRPKLSARVELQSSEMDAPQSGVAGSVFDEIDIREGSFECVRTFLCTAPTLRSAASVVQSTANHYRTTTNPRRYL